ncbi:MAG: polyphenol oxidase family protein [Coriobacteriia bacterium]|nr:polyphenol oxidase family protein [Coriobacteriia bacterium]
MSAFGEFELIEASGLGPNVFAGTVSRHATDGSEVDFTAGTDYGEKARSGLASLLAPAPLTWLDLKHGTDVVLIDGTAQADLKPAADAAIINCSGRAVAFTTADCVPIIVSSPSAVLAVHAGWRGIAGGIIELAIERLSEATALQPGTFHAWVGPSIDQANYEIDDQTGQLLLARPAVARHRDLCLVQNRIGHCLADLPKMAEVIMLEAGLHRGNIVVTGLSTYERNELHSARRDGEASGRMATFAALSAGQGWDC